MKVLFDTPKTHDVEVNAKLASLASIHMFSKEQLKNMKVATTYLRRSSAKQVWNHSLIMQLDEALKKSNEMGYIIFKETVFIEDATSAFGNAIEDRPVLSSLISLFLSDDYDFIQLGLFYNISRADRTGMIHVAQQQLSVYKPFVTLHTVQEDKSIDFYETESLTYGVGALRESHEKRLDSVKRQKRMLENKKRPSASVPTGFISKGGDIEIDEAKKVIILFIFHLTSCGYSTVEIAKMLTESKVLTLKGGIKWCHSTVNYMLNNLAYSGILDWNIRKVEPRNYSLDEMFPEIMPKTLFEIAHRVHRLKCENDRLDTPFLLNGIIHCKNCTSTLIAKNNSSGKVSSRIYRCENCRIGGKRRMNYVFNAEYYHQKVSKNLQKRLDNIINGQYVELRKNIENHINVIEQNRKRVKSNIEQIKFLQLKFSSDELYIEQSLIQKQKLEDDAINMKKTIETLRQMLQQENREILLDMYKIDLTAANNREKRLFFLLFVKKFEVGYTKDGKELYNVQFDMEATDFYHNKSKSVTV